MKTRIPLHFADLKGNGLHLLIKVRINKRKALLVLDTGASKTVLDKTRSEQFVKDEDIRRDERLSSGLGTNSMESFHARLRSLQVGTMLIEPYNTMLLDLSHVNMAYDHLGFAPIDGVLGSDLLLEYKAVIDYGKKELVLTHAKVTQVTAKKKAAKAKTKKVVAKKSAAKKPVSKKSSRKKARR